jgi:hypothetical protein
MDTDGEIRTVQFTPTTASAIAGIANGGRALIIQLDAVFGAES